MIRKILNIFILLLVIILPNLYAESSSDEEVIVPKMTVPDPRKYFPDKIVLKGKFKYKDSMEKFGVFDFKLTSNSQPVATASTDRDGNFKIELPFKNLKYETFKSLKAGNVEFKFSRWNIPLASFEFKGKIPSLKEIINNQTEKHGYHNPLNIKESFINKFYPIIITSTIIASNSDNKKFLDADFGLFEVERNKFNKIDISFEFDFQKFQSIMELPKEMAKTDFKLCLSLLNDKTKRCKSIEDKIIFENFGKLEGDIYLEYSFSLRYPKMDSSEQGKPKDVPFAFFVAAQGTKPDYIRQSKPFYVFKTRDPNAPELILDKTNRLKFYSGYKEFWSDFFFMGLGYEVKAMDSNCIKKSSITLDTNIFEPTCLILVKSLYTNKRFIVKGLEGPWTKEKLKNHFNILAEKHVPPDVADALHLLLGVAGTIPVVGILFDGADAVLYFAESRYADGSIAAIAMIPVAGIPAGVANSAKKAFRIFASTKMGKGVIDLTKPIYLGTKYNIDVVVDGYQKIKRISGDSIIALKEGLKNNKYISGFGEKGKLFQDAFNKLQKVAQKGAKWWTKYNTLGTLGPGVLEKHVKAVQRFANETGETIVIFGSRQTGKSVHTGKTFNSKTDLDLGVVGGPENLDRLLDGKWMKVPDVKHDPFWIFSSEKKALEKGFLIIKPK